MQQNNDRKIASKSTALKEIKGLNCSQNLDLDPFKMLQHHIKQKPSSVAEFCLRNLLGVQMLFFTPLYTERRNRKGTFHPVTIDDEVTK